MNTKHVSLGFDLRANPDLQRENPLQRNQRLAPEIWSPITADPNVWLAPEEIEPLWQGILPDFSNPLHLAKNLDLLAGTDPERGLEAVKNSI
jgi:hypothetical protein